MNNIEFKYQLVFDKQTDKYVPAILLCDLDKGEVIGTKYFKTESEAESYKKIAQRKLISTSGALHEIIGGFTSDGWFGGQKTPLSKKEAFAKLATIVETMSKTMKDCLDEEVVDMVGVKH